MTGLALPFLVLGLGLLGLAAMAAGWAFRAGAALSRRKISMALMPSLWLLVLYGLLVPHLYHGLGRNWPESIGERGFTSLLKAHASLAFFSFGILELFTLLIWPLVLLTFAAVPALRAGLFYVAVFGVGVLVAFGALFLAPTGFLNWWWD